MYVVAVIEEGNWVSLFDDVNRFNGGALFDAVLCLGNSFAHLPDFESDFLNQRRALRNFKSLLKPGGILIIDHRNYDDILTSGQVPSKNIYYNVSGSYRTTLRLRVYVRLLNASFLSKQLNQGRQPGEAIFRRMWGMKNLSLLTLSLSSAMSPRMATLPMTLSDPFYISGLASYLGSV